MTVDDWRALVAELVAIFDTYDDESNLAGIYDDMKANGNAVLERARVALAETEPEGPTDLQIDALVHDCLEENGHSLRTIVRHALARWGKSSSLNNIEQYRLQMAAISTAAIGYWKEGDGIHPDYDTPTLRDVAKLYAKYEKLTTEQP